MGLIQRIKDARGSKQQTTTQEIVSSLRVNALCSSYENLFPQVQSYIDEMDVVVPYGVGRNGARLPESRTPELALLQNPNEEMGWNDFIDIALATWLTESELNIHVWKNSRGKIDGYTILPPNCRQVNADGSEVFRLYTNNHGYEELTSDDVMTLRFSRSPRNVNKGVSPASSVETYAQLDDLMAQLQKARFENGATPDTITIIRAKSREQYDDTRRKMERGYQGAGNKGKTMFIWRQSLDNGDTADEVEVKVIGASNTSLALGELNKIITDRLNKAFRVSNFILGDDSSAKYDNAELSQARFVEKCIYPALRRFWSQFQHELDRITGGLGYGISFDLEVPELTDRAKVRAEILEIRNRTLTSMIEAGSSPSAAVQALNLGDEWLPVASGIYSQVLRGASITSTGDSHLSQKDYPRSCDCGHDCPNNSTTCQDRNADQNPRSTQDAYMPVFSKDEEVERKIYEALMQLAERIVAENPNLELEQVKEDITKALIATADEGANAGAGKIQALVNGKDIAEEIKTTLENDGYHISEEWQQNLADRTSDLVDRFEGDTRAVVNTVLTAGREEGKSASQIKKELSEVMPRARAEMIARNETVYAFKSGRLENDRYLANRYGIQIKLVWRTSKDSNVCPVCAAMDGTETTLGRAFVDSRIAGDSLTEEQMEEYNLKPTDVLSWEHTKWNDGGRTPNAHVNCRCYFDEVVE